MLLSILFKVTLIKLHSLYINYDEEQHIELDCHESAFSIKLFSIIIVP